MSRIYLKKIVIRVTDVEQTDIPIDIKLEG
jgi:hypothetical protein